MIVGVLQFNGTRILLAMACPEMTLSEADAAEARPIALPEPTDSHTTLCRTYAYPIYAYVRRKGYEPGEALKFTHVFFGWFLQEAVISQDHSHGRFRSFLLASLKQFLAGEWTSNLYVKRGDGDLSVALDGVEAEERYQVEPPATWTADRVYERRWALTVLEKALIALEQEYSAAGSSALFGQLHPFVSGDNEPLAYAELAGKLQMTEGGIRAAVHCLRHRYADAVRNEILKTVRRPEEIEPELHHLFTALS
jgi:RNA polymerase sigma-70 factor (ECF subfamily)